MNPFCPNKSNPQVKREFDELVDVFGEDLAYFLWDHNEGYSIDRAPDGARSALFLSHLKALNGDRVMALKATAKDLIHGKTHSDVEYHPDSEHPLEQIKQTVEEIGMSDLVDTLISQGIDKTLAKSIYRACKSTKGLRKLKPIDIYGILSQQRDASLKDGYNKRILAPVNRELEKHLISILYSYGFEVKDLGELITADESVNLENIAAAYDIFNKIIYLAKNRNEVTMPEEFAHAFIKMMGSVTSQNPEYKELYNLVEHTDIYKQVYEKYKDIYVYHNHSVFGEYTKPNIRKIKEEAIGQALAVLIVNKWNEKNLGKTEESKSFFQKLKDWVFTIVDKINKKLRDSDISYESYEDQLNFEKILEKLSSEIINKDLQSLNKVDDSSYSLLDYYKTIEEQNKKDGGIALRFMQKHVELGVNITGSMSYRLQGTIYRSGLDSLHDIDMTVPFSVHEQSPHAYWNSSIGGRQLEEMKPFWDVKKEDRDENWKKAVAEINDKYTEQRLNYLLSTPFFQKIIDEYPDMVFTTAYMPDKYGYGGFVVSSVWSSDNNLSNRFKEMRGSYADRLAQFTEEERSKIYLFDYFLVLDESPDYVEDEENKLRLNSFDISFQKKINEMGRPKDLFDYQRWQVFEKYKNQYIPTAEGLMFQEKPNNTTEFDEDISLYTNAEEYIIQSLSQYMKNHPDLSDEEINIKRREFLNEYVQKRQREIMNDSAVKLAEAFGLVRQADGSWMSQDDDWVSRLRVEFVNSIDEEHEGSYEHNSLSVSAHHIIRIGLDKGDPTTFNHEMAHHYVRLFWNSDVIQDALKIVDKPGMTDVEREEALVDKMVEISIQNVYGTIFDNQNFFHIFWGKIANMLYNVFNIKTKTVRDNLMKNVTKSFMLNEQLSVTQKERDLFNMADQIMYKNVAVSKLKERRIKQQNTASYTATTTSKNEELTETIIRHTENKDKAYTRRGGINEGQILKLQEAVYAVRRSAQNIKDAIAAKRVEDEFHEKANLIIDYMDRAAEEIAESARAFQSAMANNYKQFVYNLNPDGTILYTSQGNKRKDITFDDLVNIKTDILNFHAGIIGNIGTMLSDISQTEKFSSEDIDRIKDKYNTLQLSKQIDDFQSVFDAALDKACIRDIIQYVDENVALEEDMKTRLKINMLKWLRDQNDFGDVSIYEQWIGLGSHSKSPIIRMMQDMINDMLYERDTPVEKRGKELVSLLSKARKSTTSGWFDISKYNIKIGKFNLPTPWNIQKLLMEMDERGLPTGNLISRINRGKYYRDKENFIAELLFGKDGNGGIEQEIRMFSVNGTLPYKDFEVQLDKYMSPIFPEDPSLDSICKKYYKEMEKWRCEHEDRQYTEKYYMERVDALSVKTLRALDSIQQRVGEIYSVCTIKGVVRTDLLSAMQKEDLKKLRAQRAQLYNFYNEDGSLKPDGSDGKQIAEELAKWSLKIRGKIQYKIDQKAFDKAKSLAKNKQRFYEENTELVINPKVWEYYNRLVGSKFAGNESDPDVQKLNKLIYVRNKMLAQVKANGFGFTNMSELWDEDNKKLKNREYWKNLRSIETSIHNLRAILKDRYRSGDKSENKNNFGKVFNSIYNPIDEKGAWFGNNVPRWVNHIHKALRVTSPDDIKLLYLEGTSEPLSIFSTLVPYFTNQNGRHVQTDDLGQTYDILIRVPNSNFSVLDVENSSFEYVNKDYKNEDGKTYTPKESVYKNKDFDKFEQDGALKDLYDHILNTMNESWSKFPFLHEYDYRLPQMRGRTGQILGRRRNIFKSIGYQLASWWEINETDEWMNNDYQTRPDGSRIDFVPIRFIKRLEKPEFISSDVVGSVISFYEMANNFEVKSKMVGKFEAYLTKFEKNEPSSKQSWHNVPQSKILSHMTDVQLYGREQDIVVDSKKKDKHGSNAVKGWMKRVRASRGWAQASLLAHNYASAIVSFLDPLLSLTIDMLTGKYTNYKDFSFALGVMFSDVFRAGASFGSVNTYSKANAAMQYFQLGKNNQATFKDLDKSQVYRFLSDDLGMKLFSMGDYTISCITMISTMNNYKLYTYKDSTDSNPHKKFLKKDEFIAEALKDGRSEEDARQMYDQWFGLTSLWDAFELKDGRFVVKNEFANFVDDTTMKNVRKQAQSRSSIYNGVVGDNEKTRLQTNIWTSFITMLRNFFIMGISERWKNLRDFQVADYEKYSELNLDIESGELINSTSESIKKAKTEQSYLKGGYNFSTRTIEDGVFIGFGNALRHLYTKVKYYLRSVSMSAQEKENAKKDVYKMSEFDKYAATKVSLEIGTIAALMIFAVFISGKADKDPDDYMTQLLALIMTRLPSERMTFYSPTLISDLITSPTSAVSAYRRFLRITDLSMDLVGLSDYDINDTIKYGSYAGQKRWVRDICGIFSNYGLHNAFTNTNAKSLKEKNKYYKKLLPIRTTTMDAILEVFGIDFISDKSSSKKSNPFGNSFGSSFNNNAFSSSF